MLNELLTKLLYGLLWYSMYIDNIFASSTVCQSYEIF